MHNIFLCKLKQSLYTLLSRLNLKILTVIYFLCPTFLLPPIDDNFTGDGALTMSYKQVGLSPVKLGPITCEVVISGRN